MADWPPLPPSRRCSAIHRPGVAAARALAVAARWRQGGADAREPAGCLAPLQGAALPPLPASTSFATLDKDGNAVACSLSMDNLFGTGRVLPGLGILLAASPAAVPPPLYSAAIAWNDNIHAFRAAVGGSGQAGAPMAVAVGMLNALRTDQPMAARFPIRAAPTSSPAPATCRARTAPAPGRADPRDAGLAAGGS